MAQDVILRPFAMRWCAKPCRVRASRQQFAAAALALLSWAGHGCDSEREDFTDLALAEMSLMPATDPALFARCEDTLRAHYQGARYDDRLILQCSDADCAGAEWVAAEGHRVVNALTTLSLLVVDVGTPDEVLGWACRYALDPAYQGAFSGGFPNLTLD